VPIKVGGVSLSGKLSHNYCDECNFSIELIYTTEGVVSFMNKIVVGCFLHSGIMHLFYCLSFDESFKVLSFRINVFQTHVHAYMLDAFWLEGICSSTEVSAFIPFMPA
jgi:hypothetical protein